jgi:hypothetical protein
MFYFATASLCLEIENEKRKNLYEDNNGFNHRADAECI